MRSIQLAVIFLGIVFFAGTKIPSVDSAEPALITSAVAPVYPPLARHAGIDGDVSVNVKIDPDGKVTAATAVDGHQLLKDGAVEAAQRWSFVPETKDRRERMARLTFTFIILPAKSQRHERGTIFCLQYYKIEIKELSVA